MTTSGTYNFSITVNDLILSAYDILGILGQNQSPSGQQQTKALKALNIELKFFAVKGIRIWAVKRMVLAYQTPTVVTGTDGNAYTCLFPHTTSANTRPITGDRWQSFWTPGGINPVAWVVNTPAISSAVYDIDPGVMDIDNGRVVYSSSTQQVLTKISRTDFYTLNQKAGPGIPCQFYFERKEKGEQSRLYLFGYPQANLGVTFEFDYYYVPQDAGNAINTLDLTYEVQKAMIWRVADSLATSYPALPKSKRDEITLKAEAYTKEAMGLDSEPLDIRFMPGFSGGYGGAYQS